ncbi:MAG: ANTAR domain-containing protein [Lachnospiraceae bacterium]|nr:ANTAR domain-containing protein [Lachnospiraceae bacterium]
MTRSTDRQLNILVVSSSGKFNEFITKVLMNKRYAVPDITESASKARRRMNERDYDCVIVNTPLIDEYGVDFCMDIGAAYNVGILMLTTAETYTGVADKNADLGVMTLARPFTNRSVDQAIRLICAIRDKYRQAEEKVKTLEEKMEEIRLTNRAVNKAKWILIEREGMSEDEAHRHIEKTAMDSGFTRREVAEGIIGRGS